VDRSGRWTPGGPLRRDYQSCLLGWKVGFTSCRGFRRQTRGDRLPGGREPKRHHDAGLRHAPFGVEGQARAI